MGVLFRKLFDGNTKLSLCSNLSLFKMMFVPFLTIKLIEATLRLSVLRAFHCLIIVAEVASKTGIATLLLL